MKYVCKYQIDKMNVVFLKENTSILYYKMKYVNNIKLIK